jgi:ferritin
MLQEPVLQALTIQMNHEFDNFRAYKSFSAIADFQSLLGTCSWFDKQSQEEYTHFNKFFNYISDRGHIPQLSVAAELPPQILTIDMLFMQAVQLEMKTTTNLELVADACKLANDDQTYQLVLWFLNEQIEEEKMVQDIYKRVLMSMNNLLLIDNELGSR